MVVVRGEQGWSRYVTQVTFQPWLLDLAIRGCLLLICIEIITDTIEMYYKPSQIPFRSIPDAIPFW